MQHDRYYLDILRNLVVEKAGMGAYSSWTQTDILLLIEAVEEVSRITLSVNTVKRFFGLLKVSEDYLPQRDTRDAFSKYVGFSNGWKDLVAAHAEVKVFANQVHDSDAELPETIGNQKLFPEAAISYKPKKLKKVITIATLMAIVIVGLFVFLTDQAKLIEVNQDGYAPITKVWAIKRPFWSSDSFFIDYDVHEGKIPIKSNKDTATFTYHIPAVSYVRLYQHDKLVSSVKSILFGDDRVCLYQKHQEKFGFQDSPKLSGDTILFYPKTLSDATIDSSVTTARGMMMWLKPMKVPLESVEWELKLEHLKRFKERGQMPRLLQLALDSKESQVYIILRDKGYNKYSYLQIGDLTRDGSSADLSALQFDLASLQTLKVTIKQKTLCLSVNGQQLYQTKFKSLPGELCGLTVTATPVYGLVGETIRNSETGQIVPTTQSNLK